MTQLPPSHQPQAPLSEDDKVSVTLLCFADTIISTLVEKAKPGSRRYNKLMSAHLNIERADETYVGYLPKDYQDKAEQILGGVEASLLSLIENDPT